MAAVSTESIWAENSRKTVPRRVMGHEREVRYTKTARKVKNSADVSTATQRAACNMVQWVSHEIPATTVE